MEISHPQKNANKKTRSPQTVDLSAYPELAVMYFGMQALTLRGIFTLFTLHKRVRQVVKEKPEGLLHSEFILYSLFPLNYGMRQYWTSFDILENWARKTSLHLGWWKGYLTNPNGTGVWHEIYCLNGGYEAIYNSTEQPIGLSSFAPTLNVQGKLRMAKNRLALTLPETETHTKTPQPESQ